MTSKCERQKKLVSTMKSIVDSDSVLKSTCDSDSAIDNTLNQSNHKDNLSIKQTNNNQSGGIAK